MIIGTLFILLLATLAIWQIISRWLTYMRLELHGRLIQARVTDIKQETRLVTQTGGANSTYQKLQYESFLYARWQDPRTQQIYTFRIKISDFYQFSIGEEIPIKLNLYNPNEYRLQYSSDKHYAKKAMPKSDTTYPDYREGYQVTHQETDTSNPIELTDKEIYEKPKASYPQELPEQQ